MTEQQIGNILHIINTANVSEKRRDSAAADVLQLAAESFTKKIFSSFLTAESNGLQETDTLPTEKRDRQKTGISFTRQEIKKMPTKYRKIFAHGDLIVPYRLRKDGVYEARVRKKNMHIEVSAKDFDSLKQKFIRALQNNDSPADRQKLSQIKFGDFARKWLEVKKNLVKPSTFKEYDRLFQKNLLPTFGHCFLEDIDRDKLQNYLLGFVREGKNRTAEKLSDLLRCIFDVAADDFKIPSPMAKVVLPRYQTKKGNALTCEEEAKLVRYCIKNPNSASSSAILTLLYFGMRQSELPSLKVIDDSWLEIETSKERLGKDVVLRRAPFTPMVRKILPYIDFTKARSTNLHSIASTVKRILPNHHVHELRHTYVSRCKECGVTGEVVSLWVGHSLSGTITSTVYTHYSTEFQQRESEKVLYDLPL
mgnify:FL=1